MKAPRFDERDGLVLLVIAGQAAMVYGIALLSPAAAWIAGGLGATAWGIWRLS